MFYQHARPSFNAWVHVIVIHVIENLQFFDKFSIMSVFPRNQQFVVWFYLSGGPAQWGQGSNMTTDFYSSDPVWWSSNPTAWLIGGQGGGGWYHCGGGGN